MPTFKSAAAQTISTQICQFQQKLDDASLNGLMKSIHEHFSEFKQAVDQQTGCTLMHHMLSLLPQNNAGYYFKLLIAFSEARISFFASVIVTNDVDLLIHAFEILQAVKTHYLIKDDLIYLLLTQADIYQKTPMEYATRSNSSKMLRIYLHELINQLPRQLGLFIQENNFLSAIKSNKDYLQIVLLYITHLQSVTSITTAFSLLQAQAKKVICTDEDNELFVKMTNILQSDSLAPKKWEKLQQIKSELQQRSERDISKVKESFQIYKSNTSIFWMSCDGLAKETFDVDKFYLNSPHDSATRYESEPRLPSRDRQGASLQVSM